MTGISARLWKAGIAMADYARIFSSNLRRLRKSAGLTQAALGGAIGYSEKAVSKWECGFGMPDIDGLFALSGILGVSLEELFADDREVYLLGIDGGGTKTAMVLADSEGNALRELKTDCCNPVDIGMDRCQQVLKSGIYQICEGIPLSSVVMFAGIAGGAAMKEQLTTFFSNFHFRLFDCDSDNCNIMQAGLHESDGITLIMGTGICAWIRRGETISRIAGRGYLIDEGGSAYNIGQEALKAYFGFIDGIGAGGLLVERIGALCPHGTQALLRKVYEGGKKWIASLSPMVFQAAQDGDRIAESIIQRNMQIAANVIHNAAAYFPEGSVRVVIAGGLTEQPCVLEYLREYLTDASRYQLSVLDAEPVLGAVSLAKKLWNSQTI